MGCPRAFPMVVKWLHMRNRSRHKNNTLFHVAEREYGSAQAWTLIHYANQGKLNGIALVPGSEIYIPCTAGQTVADPTPLLDDNADLKFLTGSNYAPFTDKNLPGGGAQRSTMRLWNWRHYL